MKYYPKEKDHTILELVHKTYNLVIQDKVITEGEWRYLRQLHRFVFKVNENDDNTILEDLKELSKWTYKVK